MICLTYSGWATSFLVSNLNDSGSGSLRQAILDANADGSATAGSPHIISFSITGTVNTNTAMPSITNHMTIDGHASANTIFRANANPNYRLFHINGAITVTFNRLIIQGGEPGGSNTGGGILNAGGNLTLNYCVIDGNKTGASSGGHGGGISQSSGSLSINNSTLKNNDGGTFGRGGAINIDAGTATLTNCTIHNNQCGANGGGIFAANTSTLNLINCTIVLNHTAYNVASLATGGVFYNTGVLNMTNTILANNTSVGIPNSDLNSFAATYTGTNNQNIVENCNGFNAGFCSSVSFFSNADPNLAAVSSCGLQDLFRPNTGSSAINNGTTTGAPPADICGTTWVGNPEIGSVESVNIATALDFDGNNDFVAINSPFTGFSTEMTVEVWMNVQTVTSGAGLGQATANVDNSASNVWHFELNADNTISFIVNDNGTSRTVTSSSFFNNTGWHHIVGVASPTETAIYVDGTKEATGTGIASSIQSNASASLHLGKDVRYASGRFLDGQIDEVRVWTEALCANKIIARKDCELIGDETNLVQYYNFNQGEAAGNNPSETTLLDRQSNLTAHQGTLSGFSLTTGGTSNWINGANGVSGNCSSDFPEIDMLGNSLSIVNNDATPSLTDHTDFGSVDPSSGTVVRTFTIDNSAGIGPLTVSSIFNTNTTDFTVGGISFPAVIAQGASTTFTVTFDPASVGLKTGMLIVVNDDCDENNYLFHIQGTGAITEEIAITEWLTDPSGADSQEEWVEIHNYGSSAIDLQNWRLKDEDTDDDVLSSTSYTIPAGGYVILTNDKSNFESIWFNGCSKTEVLEVSGLSLDNSSDEIILENSLGAVIWSVAYDNDATTGRATHYTESPNFTNKTWGNKAAPGINRNGNDVSTTLGYQGNNYTTDPNAITATNGDIGSPLNSPASIPEKSRGTALHLDGSNDYIDLGTATALNFTNTNSFSIETWVKLPNSASAQLQLVSKFDGGATQIGWGLQCTNGVPSFYMGAGSTDLATIQGGTTDLRDDQWHHIAVTYNGSNNFLTGVQIYIDGILQNNSSTGTVTSISGSPVTAGNAALGAFINSGPAEFMTGELDEVRIWDVALTANQIRENMHLTLNGCNAGLVAYYQMNDGTGSNTLNDYSSNNYTGNLMNMDAATDWISSSVNIGQDNLNQSNSQTINNVNTGFTAFNSAHLNITFVNHSNAEDFTVTYQAFVPNATTGIDAVTLYQNPMWTINRSSTTESFAAEYEFLYPAGTFSVLEPKKYALYWRPMNSGGQWTKISIARNISSNSIKFGNISLTGQFMVVQESGDLVSDVRGHMYNFDGVDARIDLGAALLPTTGVQDFTISAWIKTTENDGAIVTQYQGGTNTTRFGFRTTGGELIYWRAGTRVTSTGANINDGNWHHIAVTRASTGAINLYIDGVVNGTGNDATAIQNANTVIGNFGLATNVAYSGAMDEVRIWNTIRTQSEIRRNMHLTLRGNEAGLVAYYQFNNDDPAGTANGVKDAIGGNNGVAQNMVVGDYIPSEVAVASGVSDQLTIGAAGLYTFPNTGISIEFGTTTPDGELVISRLETEKPHGWQSLTGDVDNEYFIVHNYGNNQTFSALVDLTLDRMRYIHPADVGHSQASSPLQIYKRASNAFGASWGTTLGGAANATAGSNGTIGYDVNNGITSFSQIVVLNTGSNSDLPVDWLSFTAKRQNPTQVLLNWATGSETNNQGFEVERMLEHQNSFTKVAWVDGQGNSPHASYYQLEDDNNYQGISYYRLKQIDFDGSIEYSETKAVKGSKTVNGINIQIYPNPIQDRFIVHFEWLPKDVKTATILITDVSGQTIYKNNFAAQPYQKMRLNTLEELPVGVYMLSIELDNGEQTIHKLIKE